MTRIVISLPTVGEATGNLEIVQQDFSRIEPVELIVRWRRGFWCAKNARSAVAADLHATASSASARALSRTQAPDGPYATASEGTPLPASARCRLDRPAQRKGRDYLRNAALIRQPGGHSGPFLHHCVMRNRRLQSPTAALSIPSCASGKALRSGGIPPLRASPVAHRKGPSALTIAARHQATRRAFTGRDRRCARRSAAQPEAPIRLPLLGHHGCWNNRFFAITSPNRSDKASVRRRD